MKLFALHLITTFLLGGIHIKTANAVTLIANIDNKRGINGLPLDMMNNFTPSEFAQTDAI